MLRFIVCDYRYPNLCLSVSNGCLLLRAEPTSFCSESKKEADAIKAIYWLSSLKPAAATKKVSCRTVSQTAPPFRQPWWEDEPLLRASLWLSFPWTNRGSCRERGQGRRRDSRRKLEGKLSSFCPLLHSPVPPCHQRLLTSEQQWLETCHNLSS